MKISVIVPIYNTSLYLSECLNSLINQTYKNLEIICINDGSTDNSLEILNEYQKKDNRIKIITQENQGLSSARNKGIEEANGELISFIDSDDWVDLNFYEKLVNALKKENADIAAASIIRTRKTYSKPRVKYEKQITANTLEEKIKACNIPKCCYVWNKIYKTSIVKNRNFKINAYFEDVLWTPLILKNSNKMVCVPDTNYYYRANSSSIVKKKQTPKKQQDAYFAKKFIVNFLKENNIPLSKKEKTIIKSIKYFLNFPILKIKEYENTQKYYLFGFLPVFSKTLKAPIIKDNTFIVWEPCSKSHSEVVPGYCKYLLDLGYHVSVLVTPERYKEGLFSRFQDKNLTLNKLTQKEIKEFFKNTPINNTKGVMVTTVGKICDCIHYNQVYSAFYPDTDRKKLLFVEHEASFALDKNSWDENLITLRKLNYKNGKSIVINPHYFGDIKITDKNKDITNFITIGAIKPNKKNSKMIIDSFYEVYKRGYQNFKVTVVGKGSLKHLPKELHKFFDIKGRLPFDKMYDEIEKADFMLTSYNEDDPEHIRYNTSGTSGNFQLMYGFLKPAIITQGFAPINGLNKENAILYDKEENYPDAIEKAINMDNQSYKTMQNKLKDYEIELYKTSLENLKKIVN